MPIDPEVEKMMKYLFYAGIHQISEAEHDLMRERFFGAHPPAHKEFPGSLFNAEQYDHDKVLQVTVNYGDRVRNDDILNPVFVELTADQKVRAPEPVFYSVQYLKGLNFMFDLNNKTIHLSKSRDAKDKVGLVMKILNGENPVYFGDLTNMIP